MIYPVVDLTCRMKLALYRRAGKFVGDMPCFPLSSVSGCHGNEDLLWTVTQQQLSSNWLVKWLPSNGCRVGRTRRALRKSYQGRTKLEVEDERVAKQNQRFVRLSVVVGVFR